MAQNNQRPNLAALKRLPSLKPTRDVTLSSSSMLASATSGGVKPKFTPNLTLAGRRTQSSASKMSDDGAKPSAPSSSRFRDGKRSKRAADAHEIVQSAGLFTEGVGDGAPTSNVAAAARRAAADFGTGGGSRGALAMSSAPKTHRSTSAVGDDAKVSSSFVESDEAVLSALLNDKFISDIRSGDISPHIGSCNKLKDEQIDLYDVSESFDETCTFVQLPSILAEMLSNTCGSESNPALINVVKQEIKLEPGTSGAEQTAPLVASQLPDHDNSVSKTGHVLDTVPDGLLGKLQFLKSGKIRLKLNTDTDHEPIFLDVDASASSFSQQLVLIDNSRQTMNVLSENVRHTMLITPDVESIAKSLE